MSLLADIKTLETKIQKELFAAGHYTSIDDFVQAYTSSILDAISSLSKTELAAVNIAEIIDQALLISSDFINVEMAAQISESVTLVLGETAAFYTSQGLQVPNLREAISRSEDVQKLTDLFTENMASMREILRDETIELMQSELAQGLVNFSNLEELVFQYTDGNAHYARTNARQIVSSYNRIGRDQVRESAGLTHGYYYGDARDSTRPFCLQHIGNTYTLAEIDKMSNGQLEPVRIYAGGWNCIHSWLWVNPEWDESFQ